MNRRHESTMNKENFREDSMILFRRLFRDGELDHCGLHANFLPRVECEGQFCQAVARFWRDPHGAVKEHPSADFVERIACDNPGAVGFAWEFNLNPWKYIGWEKGIGAVLCVNCRPAPLLLAYGADVHANIGPFFTAAQCKIFR